MSGTESYMDYSSDIEEHPPLPVNATGLNRSNTLMSYQYDDDYDDGLTFEQLRPTRAADDNSVRYITNNVRFLPALQPRPPGLVRTESAMYECDPQSSCEDEMVPTTRPTLIRSESVCCKTEPYDDMDCVSSDSDNDMSAALPVHSSHMMHRSNVGPDVEYVRHLVAVMACEMTTAERMELIALLASV